MQKSGCSPQKLEVSVVAFLQADGMDMPCPSSFQWGLQDISASESGRTDDTIMHKNRVGQKRKLGVTWKGLDWSDASKVLKAFNPEYVNVTYPDAMSGTNETRTFYVGDRTAPYKCWWVGNKRVESISFDLIER